MGRPISKKRAASNNGRILTFPEKIAVIRYYDDSNISCKNLAKMFHCSETRILDTLANKEELSQQLEAISDRDAAILQEKMTRVRGKFELGAVSLILHQWVERCRQQNVRTSISNNKLLEMATKVKTLLNLSAFEPTLRFVQKFRSKHNYTEEYLGLGPNGKADEVSIEAIIIESKRQLPGFMQKEIAAIEAATAASDNDDENVSYDSGRMTPQPRSYSIMGSPVIDLTQETPKQSNSSYYLRGKEVNAGTVVYRNGILPHLYSVYQFARNNCDVQTMELIMEVCQHMQKQAAEGAYTELNINF